MGLAVLLLLACGAEPVPAQAPLAANEIEIPFPTATRAKPPRQSRKAPPPDAGVRQLWGIGWTGGFALEFTPVPGANNTFNGQVIFAGPLGLYGRVGVQANDRWGVAGELSACTFILVNELRAVVSFDYTPADWFTVAVGPSIRGDIGSVGSLGGTVRLDFHHAPERGENGRGALTWSLAFDVGQTVVALSPAFAELGSPGTAFAFHMSLGWSHY
jgi:hypothetical protein